jgi:hypothetical protein
MSQENVEIVRQVAEAINRRDADGNGNLLRVPPPQLPYTSAGRPQPPTSLRASRLLGEGPVQGAGC